MSSFGTIGVIPAGGKGTRLASLSDKPKALIKISNFVLLRQSILRYLKAGIEKIFLIIRYHINDFNNYVFQLNKEFNIRIILITLDETSYVDSPISDVVNMVENHDLPVFDKLLISYCDVITDINLIRLIRLHKNKNSLATMLLFSDNKESYLHKYTLNSSGQISSITGNNGIHQEDIYANGGVFLIEKNLLVGYDFHQKIYFSEKNGPIEKAFNKNALYGIFDKEVYYKEVGDPDSFYSCEQDLLNSQILKNKLFYTS
jgi:NDP-sugar pyrophosphorylase family protein